MNSAAAQHNDNGNVSRDNSASESSPSWWSSWNDAHLRTCQERRSLVATPQQVLDYTNANTNQDATDIIFWSLPDRCNVVEWKPSSNQHGQEQQLVQEVCMRFGNHHTLSTPTKQQQQSIGSPKSGGGLLQSVTKTVSLLSPLWGILTPGRRAPPPPPNHTQQQEDDDALRDWSSTPLKKNEADTSTNVGMLAWNQPVLNPTLTRICFEMIQKELDSSSNSNSSSSFPQVVSRRKHAKHTNNNNNSGVGSSCWKDWLSRIDIPSSTNDAMPKDFLSRLSAIEVDFLLDCMSEMGQVTIIGQDPKSGMPKEDLVVLGGGNLRLDTTSRSSSSSMSSSEEIAMFRQVLASWWELGAAQETLERRREQWSLQAQEYSQRALKERQAKLGSGLASFKMHKLFLQRLDESGGTLLNLEQARHTLEESWHQRQVVQALENSTLTLQNMRHDTEKIDELMESYREEVEHVDNVQESLSATVLGDNNAMDEDELLKDLERLTLQDDNSNIQEGVAKPAQAPTAVVQDAPENSISTAELVENTPKKSAGANDFTAAPSSVSKADASRPSEKVMLPG